MALHGTDSNLGRHRASAAPRRSADETSAKMSDPEEEPSSAFALPSELLRDALFSVWETASSLRLDAAVLKASSVRYASLLTAAYAYCFLGAFLFLLLEGWHEVRTKCGIVQDRQRLIDALWNGSADLDYDQWKEFVGVQLRDFEESVRSAHRDHRVTTPSGHRVWSFDGALVYCLTILTTIGYGHIVPSTRAGQALTMLYATIGIPLLLMVLADFGKLLTRGIKVVCSCIHRFYHTGSCRKLRRTLPIQAVSRALSNKMGTDNDRDDSNQDRAKNRCYEIDDEFDLPPWIAILLLVGYIMLGACMFIQWEKNWTYFEAVYFVFISMSTIGFGDYVPDHPIFMMGTFVYLLFGLALTSMCINVIQESLTSTFRNASEKLSQRMGIDIPENQSVPHKTD